MTRGVESLVMTIGHSTRPIEDFIALLEGNGVRRLVDVRTVPKSRYNPQFNREELRNHWGKRASRTHICRSWAVCAASAQRFSEYRLAQSVLPRIRRLHADAGVRAGATEADRTVREREGRHHVRGGRS